MLRGDTQLYSPAPSRTIILSPAMYGIKELAELLELSEKQVRRRLSLIMPHLDGHCRKGPRGKILVDEQGLELLREMILQERAGSSLTDAARSVAELLRAPDSNGHKVLSGTLPEHEGTSGQVREGSGHGRRLSPGLDNNVTLPNLPAKSGKVEISEHVLWLLVTLSAVSVLLQVAILLVLYLT